ncbi:MAG: WecB/TagA/CpsF family glycosyltransferase [Clostridiaceae bacterium]|nr:WecB/TagA/CpsF family glycosyltransferase [Clostridiaceae bacterium]
MRNTARILNTNIDKITMDEAVDFVLSALKNGEKRVIYTPNSEIVMLAYEDSSFSDILNSADLTVPDGIGVVYASRILKDPIKERVAGFDLVNAVFDRIKDTNYTVFLLGASPGVAEKAKENLEKMYPGIKIIGVHDGYFKDGQKVCDYISSLSPDILLVCLGAPKQERWIYEHKDKISAKIFIGAGGSLDVFAGNVKRAPLAWQKMGLEWLYRLIKQPSRFFRMLSLPKFLITVIFKGKKLKEENNNA